MKMTITRDEVCIYLMMEAGRELLEEQGLTISARQVANCLTDLDLEASAYRAHGDREEAVSHAAKRACKRALDVSEEQMAAWLREGAP